MAKYFKIFLLFAFLLIKHISLAQTSSLSEITAIADKLIGENKNKEALRILENVNIDDFKNENDANLASFYFVKATAYDLNDDSSNSIRMFEKACDHYEKAGITYDLYLQSLQSLGHLYYNQGNQDLAEKYYEKVIIYANPSLILHKDLREIDALVNAFYNLGIIYVKKDNIELAELCLHQTNRKNNVAYEKLKNILYHLIVNKLLDKTNKFRDDKKYNEAIVLFDKLLSLIGYYKGRQDDQFILVETSKANVLCFNLWQYEEAAIILESVIGKKDLIDHPSRDICESYCSLILCYAALNNYKKVSETLIDGYYYIKNASFNDYPPHMLYRLAGNGAYNNNDYSIAITYYEKYLDISNPKEGAANYEEIVNMLSVAYVLSGYPDKAQKLLKSFLKDNENAMIVSNPTILANIYHNLGRAIMLVRNYKDALIYLNKSKDLQMKLYGEATSRTIDYIKECIHNK